MKKGTMTEAELVELAKSDDPKIKAKAFDILIRQHMERLVSLGTKLLGSEADAADAITTTTEKAMKGIHKYEYQHPFWAWLSRIHHNVCYDELRARQKRNKKLQFISPGDAVADRIIPLDRTAPPDYPKIFEIDAQFETIVQGALGALSEKHRNIILMVFVNGMSYQQVADLLNVEIGTVMSRVSNARKFFKENLSRMGLNNRSLKQLSREKDIAENGIVYSAPNRCYSQWE